MKAVLETGEPPLVSRRSRAAPDVVCPADSLQIRTILVPLDFSEASLRALRYTMQLAETFRAGIHLVHVQPADELTALSKAGDLMLNAADAVALMQDRLEEIQRRRDLPFWPDNCHVLSGRPFAEICALASEIKADLIALPTRGHGGLKHLVLGSTAERVVRFAPCPVIVLRGARYEAMDLHDAPPSSRFQPHKVLVPVDFSACSQLGVKYAVRLARTTGARLRLLHVVFPYQQVIGFDRVGANAASLGQIARENAEQELNRLVATKLLSGLECETVVRSGSVVEEIARESGRAGIDLLVGATHGRAGFQHTLLGSVAEQILRYAQCPVLTVPARPRS